MRHFVLTLTYDGTQYAGFQIQKDASTIQGVLEKTLRDILKRKVRTLSSGRTDAGVHALSHIVSFKAKTRMSQNALKKALNALLPQDIAVTRITEAPLSFHPRFEAMKKRYRYTIRNHSARSPFDRFYTVFYPYPLNVRAMRKAARQLQGQHDFKAFQAKDKKERSSVRHIHRLTIQKKSPYLTIDIEGNGFLYKMVRNIVGTLLEVGNGRRSPEEIKTLLARKNRALTGPTVPAKGLCLLKVVHPPF